MLSLTISNKDDLINVIGKKAKYDLDSKNILKIEDIE